MWRANKVSRIMCAAEREGGEKSVLWYGELGNF